MKLRIAMPARPIHLNGSGIPSQLPSFWEENCLCKVGRAFEGFASLIGCMSNQLCPEVD